MKNSLLKAIQIGMFIMFSNLSFKVFAQQPDSWVQKKSVPITSPLARFGAVAFTIGDTIYTGTGIDDYGGHKFSNFWKYDGNWTQIADFGGGKRYEAVGFSINGKGYVGTGISEGTDPYERKGTKDFWEYNPQTNKWTKKADFGGSARFEAVGFTIGNRGYIGTGTDKNGDTKDFWEYNPNNNSWLRKADVGGLARHSGIGISNFSKGYIGLGYTNTYASDFWEYNPSTNKWLQKANISPSVVVKSYDATGFRIGDKLYVCAGYKSNTEMWEYNTITDQWKTISFYNININERSGAVGISIGKKGYIIGGHNASTSTLLNDFYSVDTEFNYWDNLSFWMYSGRYQMAGFGLNDAGFVGLGFIIDPGAGISNEFWEYNPTKDKWTPKKQFIGKGRTGAVGFNINNKGYIGLGGNFNDFWEYDRIGNQWMQKANFPGLNKSLAVGFSIKSKGYVGTGFGDSQNQKEFWEYNSITNIWNRKADFLGAARSQAIGFAINNKGYIGLGGNFKDFWEYNPDTDKWSRKADFADKARYSAVGFSIGNRGFVGTGISIDGDADNSFWEYNPFVDKWTRRANGPGGRGGAVGFTINNKGYIGTGYGLYYEYFSDFSEYTPPLENYILTKIKETKLCSNSRIRINYNASGSYQRGNRFTAQLSDSSGNFSNPTNLSSIVSTASGSINTTIPSAIFSGKNYRIRVVASKPSIYGFDNDYDICINPLPIVKTKNTTIYLDDNGKASINAQLINNGSWAYCGSLRYNLNKTTFNCSNIGVNTVILSATDCNGNKDSAIALVTVKDNDRPAIHKISVSPERLWPADHNLKQVTVNYRTWDNCGVTKTWLTSISSDEPLLLNNPDIKIIDNHKLLLRAERTRPTRIRIYTISIFAQDASGNIETRRIKIEVSPNNNFTVNLNGDVSNNSINSETLTGLQMKLMPNPTTNYSTIVLQSSNPLPVTLIVSDMLGKIIETKNNINSNSNINLGYQYKKGMYYIKVVQGIENQTIKLIKN